jgi:hypothetical protein
MDDPRPKTPAGPIVAAPSSPGPRRLTLLGVLRRHYQAVLVHHAAAAEVTILQARQQVAEAGLATLDAKTELQLRVSVTAVPPAESREILGGAVEIERLLLEREQFRQQRRLDPLAEAGAVSALPSPSAPLDWEISDEQIEALTLRAVTRFAPLSPREAERAWAGWEREARLRLSPYAAQELIRRADCLRGLTR